MKSFIFVTDTATLCIFDPQQMRHRLVDDADWWSIPKEELDEVNKGNVVFVSLGRDGQFVVRQLEGLEVPPAIRCRLAVSSGQVFVGAGEEVTSDGLEPECVRGGMFVQLAPGVYLVEIARFGSETIDVCFSKVEGSPENRFSDSLKV